MAVRLPFAYQEVEYIESSGTQYIDTGYYLNAKTDVEIGCNLDNAQANGACIFGSRPTYPSNMFVIFGSTQNVGLNYGNTDFGSVKAGVVGDTVIKKEGLNFYVGNEIVRTASAACGNISPSAQIFAMHDRGSQSFYTSGVKLHYLKIKEDGILLRDFIPARRKSDGTIGLYDLVNNAFYINAGTGTFEAGEDVNVIQRQFKPGIIGKTNVVEGTMIYTGWRREYQEVEYIESTGTQFIKTDYIPKANSNAELVANISFVTNSYPTPFGTRNASQNGAFLVFTRFNSASNLYFDFGSGELNVGSMANLYDKKITITLRPNYVSAVYDSNNKIEKSFTSGTPTSTQPIYLFTLNEAGKDYGTVCHATMKLYSFVVKEGEVEKVNMVPVIRRSDSVSGLYDQVSGKFYTNSGTGSFLPGNFVIPGTSTKPKTLWLYNRGDECAEDTGGWTSVNPQSGLGFSMGTATKNADNLYLYANGNKQSAGWTTNNAIDFTKYTKLKAVVSASAIYNRMNLHTGTSHPDTSIACVNDTVGTEIEIELDVSNISGEYYVHFGCWPYSGNNSMTIHEVWLEP